MTLSSCLPLLKPYKEAEANMKHECEQNNAISLFMVGEIGGNDYNYGLFQGKSIQDLRNMVPQVVATISNVVRNGIITTKLENKMIFQHQIVEGANNFSIYHNEHLQQAIEELKIEYPNTTILYVDYYNAFLWVLSRARFLGKETKINVIVVTNYVA
ncbi:acetylajmalan esterase-like [Forsythia ovata]|uniref:Acetylajmalan esterase-like n=1 Tax=Forsythia ovata TaxID=205694 RepID=A0ABD1PX65_9LAMI